MSCKLLQLQGWKMLIQVCTHTPGLQHFAATLPSPRRVVFKFPFLPVIGRKRKPLAIFLIGIHAEGGGGWSFNVSVMNNFVHRVEIPQCM